MFEGEKTTTILEVGKYYYLAAPLYMGGHTVAYGECIMDMYCNYPEIDVSVCYAKENWLPLYIERLCIVEIYVNADGGERMEYIDVKSTKDIKELYEGNKEAFILFGSDIDSYEFEGCLISEAEYIEITDGEEIEKVKEQIYRFNNDEEYANAEYERLEEINFKLDDQRTEIINRSAKVRTKSLREIEAELREKGWL